MTIDLARLQELALNSLQLSYNTDSPDTLNVTLAPEVYEAEIPLKPGARLTVMDGGTVIFSGALQSGANFDYQAGSAARVQMEFQSDYALLDRMVFARLNNKGEAIFARGAVNADTTTIQEVVSSISGWLDSRMPSRLNCTVNRKIPTPQSDGTSSCASLLNEAMRWVPDSVFVQRYSGSGNSLLLTTPSALGAVEFDVNDRTMQSLSVQECADLRAPVCALVGGAKGVWPAGADIRTPGAFVYAVPVQRDTDPETAMQRGGAGDSPASSKMVVRGVRVPEQLTFVKSADEYKYEPYSAQSATHKFIKRFFPELAPLQRVAAAGTCFVNVTSESDFLDELREADEEAELPDNYTDNVESWGATATYVHTEGSFPASPKNSKNVKGLRWCKAQLSIVIAVRADAELSKEVKKICQEYLPGKTKSKEGVSFFYVKKTLVCNLINRRRRVYDPATNKLCSDDPGYGEESSVEPEETQTMLDYAAAMQEYQKAASVTQHEGSVSMLYNGSVQPWTLTGKLVRIKGLRSEWENMSAVVRSVSWDYQNRKLSISFGPRSVMAFSEILERQKIGMSVSRDSAQRNAIAYDPADSEAQKETEESMSVSPSITAGADTNSLGRRYKPWTLHLREEDDVLVMVGGTIRHGNETFHIDDMDKQTDGSEWEEGKKVKIKFEKDAAGKTTYKLYQDK